MEGAGKVGQLRDEYRPDSVDVELNDGTWRLAMAAYLARYKGQSRIHTESDLRAFLAWCTQHQLSPLLGQRPHLEIYRCWMQEVRGYKPSTVSRRLSVLVGFYRTCVIDGVLEHSPAEYVRRPHVPPESPTLGLSHLQFEAMLAASRDSTNVNDFALVALLGLLGLRIFEATASIEDLGEVHGHRVLRVHGKGDKVVLVPLPPAVGRAVDRAIADRATGPLLAPEPGGEGTDTALPAGSGRSPRPRASPRRACTHTCSGTRS